MNLINLDPSWLRQLEPIDGRVELYKDDAGEWRWRRVADNGLTVGDSSEGYDERGDCLEMAVRLWGRMVNYYEVSA